MIERCGDRQRKCNGLKKWPLHFFIESLPVMLQASLFLLACGLCRHMWSINSPVAYTLVGLTGLGVSFYVMIVIAGTSSYACPFQTPASIALRSTWKKVRSRILSPTVHSRRAISYIRRTWDRRVRSLLRCQPLPMVLLTEIHVPQPEPWLKPRDLDILHRTNTNNVRCVSWILRNITDPEALDAAVRLAGLIRWFDDGTDVDPPYDMIVSTFETCFDSTRKLYPGLRDRAYYCGRAMIWIHTLAMCKSEEFASVFPLPNLEYTTPAPDHDLRHLLWVNVARPADLRLINFLNVHPRHTPSHSEWISNALFHLSWANRARLNFGFIPDCISTTYEITIPLNATLNRLLVWCIFLGWPVEEEALKVTDKSYEISCFCLQAAHTVLHQRSHGTHPISAI